MSGIGVQCFLLPLNAPSHGVGQVVPQQADVSSPVASSPLTLNVDGSDGGSRSGSAPVADEDLGEGSNDRGRGRCGSRHGGRRGGRRGGGGAGRGLVSGADSSGIGDSGWGKGKKSKEQKPGRPGKGIAAVNACSVTATYTPLNVQGNAQAIVNPGIMDDPDFDPVREDEIVDQAEIGCMTQIDTHVKKHFERYRELSKVTQACYIMVGSYTFPNYEILKTEYEQYVFGKTLDPAVVLTFTQGIRSSTLRLLAQVDLMDEYRYCLPDMSL
ncbi:hypothetical protein JAAARDRAFT_200553 [Jaapia argillacea MUCL 33604]|uniref:Uncharacterized protein n=1 Tax=Jaapia argillacea MUCL 33604 TaxID=933084 RepID=A0A067P7I9_9AGAM|nr:hypothetical protein JAAARDRAFT_200553 [Jaapia argillacea MUCL 33604]